jgi:hypothetical protein
MKHGGIAERMEEWGKSSRRAVSRFPFSGQALPPPVRRVRFSEFYQDFTGFLPGFHWFLAYRDYPLGSLAE